MSTTTNRLNFRLRNQFGMLTTQFLLGMAVNLIGLPDETTGFAHVASISLLILHLLVAIGLIIGAGQILKLADLAGPRERSLGRPGAASIGLAVIFGILTLTAPWSNLWSYLMAAAFIAAMLIYGRLWIISASRHVS